MTTLSVREAYRLWAPTYAAETVISALDEQLATEMLAGLPRRRLLDAGCGVGRRLESGVGIDVSPEMLIASVARNVVAADVRALPFADRCFDMVWCRLVLGHLADPRPAYRELARVCAAGGHVFVSDFHPEAAAAGHRRRFRDGVGTVHEIEHYVHPDHRTLAAEAYLDCLARQSGAVGPAVETFYARAGRLEAYNRDLGLGLVDAFLFRRNECAC